MSSSIQIDRPCGRGDQVVAANVEVVDGDARHVELQRAPTARRRRTTRRPRSSCRRRASPRRTGSAIDTVTGAPAIWRRDGADSDGMLARRQVRDLGDRAGDAKRRPRGAARRGSRRCRCASVRTMRRGFAGSTHRCGSRRCDRRGCAIDRRPRVAAVDGFPRAAARRRDRVDAGLAGDALHRRDRPPSNGPVHRQVRSANRAPARSAPQSCAPARRLPLAAAATIAVPTRASLRRSGGADYLLTSAARRRAGAGGTNVHDAGTVSAVGVIFSARLLGFRELAVEAHEIHAEHRLPRDDRRAVLLAVGLPRVDLRLGRRHVDAVLIERDQRVEGAVERGERRHAAGAPRRRRGRPHRRRHRRRGRRGRWRRRTSPASHRAPSPPTRHPAAAPPTRERRDLRAHRGHFVVAGRGVLHALLRAPAPACSARAAPSSPPRFRRCADRCARRASACTSRRRRAA